MDAHKRVMIANHPDRGGSPYIASKINEAKELLEKQAVNKSYYNLIKNLDIKPILKISFDN